MKKLTKKERALKVAEQLLKAEEDGDADSEEEAKEVVKEIKDNKKKAKAKVFYILILFKQYSAQFFY